MILKRQRWHKQRFPPCPWQAAERVCSPQAGGDTFPYQTPYGARPGGQRRRGRSAAASTDQGRRERLDPAQGWSLPPRRERPARPFPPPRPAGGAAGRGGPAACSPIGWIWIRSAIGRSKRERATTNQKAGRGARGSYKRDRTRGAVTRGSRQVERR